MGDLGLVALAERLGIVGLQPFCMVIRSEPFSDASLGRLDVCQVGGDAVDFPVGLGVGGRAGNSALDTCSGEVVDLSIRESELQIQINTMQLKKAGCCNLITQVPEFFCFCGLPCDPGDVRDFIFKLTESRSERRAIHARCGDQEFRARAFMHFLTQRA